MEDAGSASSMSTPQSEGGFDPFANDDLGNTVIHLDRAMHRMREYERLKAEAEGGDDASPHSSEPGQANTTSAATSTNSATSNSSAQDVGSESSISDGPVSHSLLLVSFFLQGSSVVMYAVRLWVITPYFVPNANMGPTRCPYIKGSLKEDPNFLIRQCSNYTHPLKLPSQ